VLKHKAPDAWQITSKMPVSYTCDYSRNCSIQCI